MLIIKKYNSPNLKSQREILWLFKSYICFLIAFRRLKIYNILIDMNDCLNPSLPRNNCYVWKVRE